VISGTARTCLLPASEFGGRGLPLAIREGDATLEYSNGATGHRGRRCRAGTLPRNWPMKATPSTGVNGASRRYF